MKKLKLLRKEKIKNSGIAALEASLTLPVLVILIFFILEMIKVNNTKTAMDSMAVEATLNYISTKNVEDFDDIIEKYKPKYIPKNDIKYYFTVYGNSYDEEGNIKDGLENMCSTAPYGSEEIFWPTNTIYEAPKKYYLDSNRNENFDARATAEGKGYITLNDTSKPESNVNVSLTEDSGNTLKTMSGKVIVLTFVCKYNFSSAFVKKLFAGGSNTVGDKEKEYFLIWGRGVGICD